MKKRTLVCFLIFTLCVFYTSIPNAVFGQEDPTDLPQTVFDRYEKTLQDPEVQVVLPQVLEALSDPATLQNPTIVALGFDAAIDQLLANPSLIRLVVPTATDAQIALIGTEPIQKMLSDPDVRTLLQDAEAVKEFAVLLAESSDDGTTDDGTTDDGTTDDGTTDDGTTDDGTIDDGTTDDRIADPFPPIMPTNVKSQLGGLSLNPFNSRKFVEDLIAELAPPGLTLEAEVVVDAILEPAKGYIPIKQIRQILLSKRLTPFAQDAPQLDSENFGNAITPNFADFAYRELSSKYLTSNSLHVYTRVPTKVDRVEFSLSNGKTYPGTEITLDEFQADTIPYTFRLEETLAATNLPAWPGLDNAQLFSDVRIRYSFKDPMPEGGYASDTMIAKDTGNGVVWEKPLGIPASGTVYYYFEVVLAEPLLFTALDREAIVSLDPTTVTLGDIFAQENLHKIRIDSWAMPDPRNLQLTDRGIVKELFTPDLATEFYNILTSPQVLDIAAKVYAGQQVNINEILNVATPKQLRRIQNILLRNTYALTTQFQLNRDPLLASYFTVPRVDLETQSLWVAHISDIADGNHQFKADVINADGTVIDRIQENITVDTSAPEAGIGISPSDKNAIGYLNDDDIFVATAPTAGTAAMLNIMGMPKAGDLGPGVGYLFYQMIGLNEDGTPYQGEPLLERPNTWMPLTVDSTMLVSNIWAAVQKAVAEGRLDAPSDPILQAALALSLDDILGTDETSGLLTPGTIKQFADPFLKGLEPFIGFSELNINQYQLIVETLGATVDIIDHLVPVTFSPSDHVVMPIQGVQMPLMVGDYGIRALGIDTLFNVNSHTAPVQHLRIVMPEHDKAVVTGVSIGDRNGDGIVGNRWWESGHIFANTTEGVMLTIEVPEPTDHLIDHPNASILVQYKDANGNWQDIGNANLRGLDGSNSPWKVEVEWDVADFGALVAAGNTVVEVQAIATNALTIEDQNPMPFKITLDPGVHPVDPEVLALAVDETTITQTNPDSGAPQGTFTIDAYTPQRTSIESLAMDPMSEAIASLRLEIKGGEYADWTELGVSPAKGELVSDAKANSLVEAGMQEKVPSDTYQAWSFMVDTTQLADTITKDTLEAAHALATGATDENMYSVRAIAVLSDGSDDTEDPAEQPMDSFSVDNVDDVGPLGPTNLVATSINAVDAVFVDNGDGTYTVGGLVDIYDEAVNPPTVTFTITPTAKRITYNTVELRVDEAAIADGVKILSVTETAAGEFTVTVEVEIPKDTDELEATSGPYTFHALAIDAVPNVQTHNLEDGALIDTNGMPSIDVTVMNSYRPNPGILAITVDDAEVTNPDSGAPQGTVVLNGYTHEITSPPTEMVRFEVSNDGGSEWIDVGTATADNVMMLTEEELPALIADLIKAAVNGNSDTPIVSQKWSLEVDTAALLDTISAQEDLDQAHGLKPDDNPYMVRAIAITPKRPDNDETVSEDDVNTASFSVDNIDDVGPLGPTHITTVADVAGEIVVNEDGSYTVGGIVAVADEPSTLQDNIAIFTIDPSARPITYAGGKAKLVRMNPDGTMTEDESMTTFVGDAEDEVVTITINVDDLANGTYTFHALAIDAVPNVQTHNLEDGALVDTDGMPSITVHVVNFRVSDISELAVIAVDGTDVETPPMEPIPLRESLKVSFNVTASKADDPNRMYTLNVEELSGASDDVLREVPSEASADLEKTFSLMVTLNQLSDGLYTPHGVVTKRNGWVGFPLANILLDNTPPAIMIKAPIEGHTISNLPTLRATYDDGDGSGVEFGANYYPWAMAVSPDAPNMFVSLARLKPTAGENDVVQDEVDTAVDTLVYTRKEELPGGAYQFDVTVVDRLGNAATESVAVAVDGAAPMVHIHDPASGQTFDYRRPTVSGFFAGVGIGITKFTFDGNDVAPTVEGKQFSYTHPEALTDGEHTLKVEVMDGDGRTAETSVTFDVAGTAPVISEVAPTGNVAGMSENNPVMLSAVVTDDQSAITSVMFSVDDGEPISVSADQLSDGRVEVDAGVFAAGMHTVKLVAESEGGTTEHQWMFEITRDETPPVISEVSPTGNVAGMLESNPVRLSAVVIDDQSAITSVMFSVDDGEPISVSADQLSDGRVEVDAGVFAAGMHTVKLVAESEGGTTEHQWMFEIVPDTSPPVISEVAPIGLVKGTKDDKMVTLSAVVTDEQSAIESIQFMLDGVLVDPGVSDTELIGNLNEAVADDGTSLVQRLNIALIKRDPVKRNITVEVDEPRSYTVEVIATSEGGTTKHSWTFTFARDTTPPVVSAASPTGKIAGTEGDNSVTLSTVVTDDESAITSVTISVDDVELETVTDPVKLSAGRIEVAGVFQVGVHTVKLVAESEGGTTEHQWMFEIVPDTTPPVISTVAPVGTVQGSAGSNSVPLSAVVTDEQSAIASVEFHVDGGAPIAVPAEQIASGSIKVEVDNLKAGTHTVRVVATSEGGTTEHTWTFTFLRDTTPPVISAVAPSGVITGDSWVTLSAVVTDEQSSVVSVKFGINDKPLRSVPLAQIAEGRVEVADSFTAGTHTVRVVGISEGGTTEHSWTFTLVVDNAAPAITSITPSGTIRGGLPVISASASDESGVDEMTITLWDSDGKEVKGDTEDDGENDVEGITRLDFNPEAPLDEGTYTIEVRATDTIGNSATAKGNFSVDFDTAAPVITMASPQNEARMTERRPQISITYADAESGVDVDSIRFVFDDKLINLAPNQKSASQVLYTPPADLAFGQHTVKLEVSDMAHKEGNVSEKNSGARKANMAVHEFTFFVESEEGPVLASRPINAPNPFKDNTRISFTLTRQSTVSIVIYDMTFRPVRVLVDNEVWDAGEYVGKGAIGWDGTTTAGEDLARGVYYCQIIVADGFEPEYAILKLALTR